VIETSCPLSPMQQGILFHDVSAPQSRLYIEQTVGALHEALNVTAFRSAWLRVVARHSILRTTFRWQGLDVPLQDVHRQATIPWDEQDWRSYSAPEQEARLEVYVAADRKKGIALDKAPLIRLALFRVGEADYRFLLTVHHLVIDGRSFVLLMKEVFSLYEALCQGSEPAQEAAPSYASYIEWLGQQDLAPAEKFWRQTLAGFTGPTSLTVDRARAVESGEDDYGRQNIRLSKATTQRARAGSGSLARSNQVTPSTLLMGAWALLLSRYSGDEDVVFGTTRSIHRATVEGAANIVGPLINTLPMRVRVSPDMTAVAWLKELRAQWIDARPHEHTPLAKVQEWSGERTRGPLFQSLVIFENSRLSASLRAQGGAWERREISTRGGNPFPLTVTGYLGEELEVDIAYDRSRFDDDTIARMLGHLRTLLEALIADPNRRLEELPLLTQAERHRQLVEWNDTRRDYPTKKCLHELFEQQAERTPDATAVVFEREQLTYRELNCRANQLARHLQKLGVGRETLVGLHMGRSLEMVVGLLGILKAGGAYVPLDAGYPVERVAFMLRDARIEVLLTRLRLVEVIREKRIQKICLDADWPIVGREIDANLGPTARPENLAYVIYTSGSTGGPKGVLIEHRQILNYVQGIQECYRLTSGASFAMVQPLSVDSSQTVIFPALISGGCLHVVSEARASDAKALGEYFHRNPIDLLKIAPSHLAALLPLAQPELVLPQHWLVIGGEISRWDWMGSLRTAATCSMFNHYGPTEATVGALTFPVTIAGARDRYPSATVPIGRPLPNVQAYVLDRHRQPSPIGVPGELHIGGSCLARGYLNRPELTAEKFIPDLFSDEPGARLYRTGDLARFLPSGDVEFCGRVDDQVKIRGFRVEPAEIESALSEHSGVRDCVVVAREDDSQSMRLIAYVVPEPRSSPAARDLRDFLASRLPTYMVPSVFVFVDALPRTPHGKLDRRALPEVDYASLRDLKTWKEPRDPVEKTLATIWAQLLRVERVGLDDNFFDFGGDSLLAMQFISRVRVAFPVEIPLHNLFETPTIAELAEMIRRAGNSGV
jgi:amino acid adenylation domain-containing protein